MNLCRECGKQWPEGATVGEWREHATPASPRFGTHYDALVDGSHGPGSCIDPERCDCTCQHCLQVWHAAGRPGPCKGKRYVPKELSSGYAGTRGPDYDPKVDADRLDVQLVRVRDYMLRNRWKTLDEIHAELGDPVASISAQLRHLRKPRFGEFIVLKRHRGEASRGLWEYRVLPPDAIDLLDAFEASIHGRAAPCPTCRRTLPAELSGCAFCPFCGLQFVPPRAEASP